MTNLLIVKSQPVLTQNVIIVNPNLLILCQGHVRFWGRMTWVWQFMLAGHVRVVLS